MTNDPMTEESLRDELKALGETVTMDTLPAVIADVMNRPHDYGTICVALGGLAALTAKACDRHPENGGITGFQAGAVFWEFTKAWGGFGDGPKRMVTYNDLLYPQYADKFREISASTWQWVQKRASELLAEKNEFTSPAVVQHWQAIAGGVVPFGLTVEVEVSRGR